MLKYYQLGDFPKFKIFSLPKFTYYDELAISKFLTSQALLYIILPVLPQIEECLVCSVNTANMLLKPCGHMVACGTCSSLMRKCVQCRVPIVEQTPIVIPQRQKGMKLWYISLPRVVVFMYLCSLSTSSIAVVGLGKFTITSFDFPFIK